MGIKTKTSWEKGQSGNPNGRPPKGETLTDALLQKISKEELAEKIKALIDSGDATTIRFVYNHIDGMPTQKQILASDENEPFTIKVHEIKDLPKASK